MCIDFTNTKPKVIKFWIPNCIGCERIKPIFDSLRETYSEKLEFYDLNFREHRGLGPKFKLRKMPCVVVLKNENDFECISGAQHPDIYKEAIQKIIAKEAEAMFKLDDLVKDQKMTSDEKVQKTIENGVVALLNNGASIIGIPNHTANKYEWCMKAEAISTQMGPMMQLVCPLNCGIQTKKDGSILRVDLPIESVHEEKLSDLKEDITFKMVEAYLQELEIIPRPVQENAMDPTNMDAVLKELQNKANPETKEGDGVKDNIIPLAKKNNKA